MRKITQEEFIKVANQVHCNKYIYSKTKYISAKEKICIICPEHGEFWQNADSHKHGCGCPTCARKDTENGRLVAVSKRFIQKASKKYNNKYDYSLVKYIDRLTPVIIICPIHGQFEQSPLNHLRAGCAKCAKELQANEYRKSFSQFTSEARLVHGDYYDYSLVEYKNNKTKIKIICPKHGIFEQAPQKHLCGSGCPKCRLKSQTKLFNQLCEQFTNNNFIFEATIKDIPWISTLRIDIYMPDFNIAIECDGPQHFEEVSIWNRDPKELLELTQHRDKLKQQLCEQNNCLLLRIKYNFTQSDFNRLVNQIKNRIEQWDLYTGKHQQSQLIQSEVQKDLEAV